MLSTQLFFLICCNYSLLVKHKQIKSKLPQKKTNFKSRVLLYKDKEAHFNASSRKVIQIY